MEMLKINGNHKLSGTIEIGGAKNSAVALIPAAILSDEVIINNVPNISDIKALEEILNYLGAEFKNEENKVTINSKKLKNKEITLEHCQRLRASYYFMGALLGKFKQATMYFPGGCPIGKRPIDYHLKAFQKMGAKIEIEDETKYIIKADKLKGAEIKFPFASVGATINVLLAASLAEGRTTIHNAAKEPEVTNLIDFLNSMGAKIQGRGTNTLIIDGVKKLSGGKITVIPDRIEAGTYIIAGAMIGDNLTINSIEPEHISSLIDKLKEMNANIIVNEHSVTVSQSDRLLPCNITTEVYPGFPTDLQQPITALMCLASGESHITETIYENRFQNVKYLNDMGANIIINNKTIKIKGNINFKGEEVTATDLRAGACLLLAALAADGTTIIKEVRHVLRGYENIIEKLTKVGAQITLEHELEYV